MSEQKQTVAIVCGGGPAPGMNGVISAVTLEAHRQGWDVLGMYEGFSHLAKGEKKYVKLTDDDVSRIHLQGGCVLQMSRYNPTKKEEDLSAVVNTLKELAMISRSRKEFRPLALRRHALWAPWRRQTSWKTRARQINGGIS